MTTEEKQAEAELIEARRKLIEAQLAAGMQPTYGDIEATNLADLLRNRDQPVPVYEQVQKEPDYFTYVILAIAAFMILKKGGLL